MAPIGYFKNLCCQGSDLLPIAAGLYAVTIQGSPGRRGHRFFMVLQSGQPDFRIPELTMRQYPVVPTDGMLLNLLELLVSQFPRGGEQIGIDLCFSHIMEQGTETENTLWGH